jgi:hypothetical protein
LLATDRSLNGSRWGAACELWPTARRSGGGRSDDRWGLRDNAAAQGHEVVPGVHAEVVAAGIAEVVAAGVAEVFEVEAAARPAVVVVLLTFARIA